MGKKEMKYSPLRMARSYLHYYLSAASGKGHGIHSPFVYEFVTKVLNDTRDYAEYGPIEALRERLWRDDTRLEIDDMGAGGETGTRSRRTVGEIARSAAKPRRLGQLLFRMARYYHPSTILELGTSLGLSTAYLAAGAGEAQVYTMEGSTAVASVARENLRSQGHDVRIVRGNFDDELGPLLERIAPLELVFIDGNHRYEPTLRYFENIFRHAAGKAVLIFDDIHWSEGMERAWRVIRNHPGIMMTIDLFFMGLVFIGNEFKVKQDFVIRF